MSLSAAPHTARSVLVALVETLVHEQLAEQVRCTASPALPTAQTSSMLFTCTLRNLTPIGRGRSQQNPAPPQNRPASEPPPEVSGFDWQPGAPPPPPAPPPVAPPPPAPPPLSATCASSPPPS